MKNTILLFNLFFLTFLGEIQANTFFLNSVDSIGATLISYKICYGECQEIKPEIQYIIGKPKYKWNTGDTTASITVCLFNGQFYYVTISDEVGDSIVLSSLVLVGEDQRIPSPEISYNVCEGDKIVLRHPNFNVNTQYFWSGPNGFYSNTKDNEIYHVTQQNAGKYSLYLGFYDKCFTDTLDFEITVNDKELFKNAASQIGRCNIVCDITSLNGLEGIIGPNNSMLSQPDSLCAPSGRSPSNISWFAFVAQPGSWQIFINPKDLYNPNGNPGVQMGIYADKDFSELVACKEYCNIYNYIIKSSDLTPGKTYYAYIDGCNGTTGKFDLSINGNPQFKYCTDYVPMESATDWRYSYSDLSGNSTGWMSYKKDTVIVNKTYRYIKNPDFNFEYLDVYLREDKINRKVYEYVKSLGGERLLYDFSLKVGGIVIIPNSPVQYKVIRIDTFYSKSGPLKRWIIGNQFFTFSYAELLGGKSLQYYETVFASDPVGGVSCVYNQCQQLYGGENCDPSPVREMRDTTLVQICHGDSYEGHNISGFYTTATPQDNGCSIYKTTQLDIMEPLNTFKDSVICYGNNYLGFDTSGNYEVTYTSNLGCDSILNLHLTVSPAPIITQQQINICEGSSIVINNQTINAPGIYADTLYTADGCISSIVSINIGLIPLDTVQIDTILCEGYSILGFDQSGKYTIDTIDSKTGCLLQYILHLSVLPLTDPGCITHTIDNTPSNWHIVPNPAKGSITLYGNELTNLNDFTFCLYNAHGIKVSQDRIKSNANVVDIATLPPGLYIYVIKQKGNSQYIGKLVIE